ncbi:DUF4806 domain-containing protein [Caenorhabditis elegans]|uniref:DUF4806 domain-containing protein n=1 Tax=Caenorhabditis elegans TaxID=6239 RepID=Q564T2_CAEEL|nr:DUF4806 domain-containing protein [Caenorhabditis elegans]CAI79262.1 DUF4806 domain-containing protein [Caenorhabditis elegans]|eukprot:NP_001024307.1 Uncharacterized protein CELE_ZK228.10 [Caenorhabditis elegans]
MELEAYTDCRSVSNFFNNNAIDNRKAYLFSNCSVNISQVAELNLDSLDLSLDEYESLVLKMIAGHQAEIKKLQKKLADVRTKKMHMLIVMSNKYKEQIDNY